MNIPPELVVVLSIIGVGLVAAVAAGGTIVVMLRRVENDPKTLDATEKLFLSFPPETLDIIKRVADTLDVALEIVKKVTDGKPNEVTPPPVIINVPPTPPAE